jgi:hypothetical protein
MPLLSTLNTAHTLKRLLIAIALSLISNSASALLLTAICDAPKGRAMGKHGSSMQYRSFDRIEGMSSKIRIKINIAKLILESSDKSAQITYEDQQGIPSLTETPNFTHLEKGQITMIVTYPVSVFMYSLMLDRKLLLLTKHTITSGLDFNAARMLAMQSSCTIEFE